MKTSTNKPIEMKPCGMVSDRATLDDAVEYFQLISNGLDKQDKVYVDTAFLVLWNTLANNYNVTLKEGK